MSNQFNIHGTGKDLGPFELDWTDENREKIEVCLLQGGLILESSILTPVDPIMGVQSVNANGVVISGQIELVLGDRVDKLVADLRWSGHFNGSFSGILAQFG